jgi:hypothetical protein
MIQSPLFDFISWRAIENLPQYYKKRKHNTSGWVSEGLDILPNKMTKRRDKNFCTSKFVLLLSDFED